MCKCGAVVLVDPGFAFWPKAQQYRHIIPSNPQRIIGNCNLYDLAPRDLKGRDEAVLVGVMNSTLVGLFKTFCGRYAGTEGNLKTEVVDVNLLDVPDPRSVPEAVADRIIDAVNQMSKREVGRLVDESLMECRTYERAMELAARALQLSAELRQPDRRELDDAVFELLGVASPAERRELVDRLHQETAQHFRAVRVTEIQKMEDRRSSAAPRRFDAKEQAADAWDAVDLTDLVPLAEWVRNTATGPTATYTVPEDRPAELQGDSMFDQRTVYFGRKRQAHLECPSRGTAEVMHRMATLGVAGPVTLPTDNAKAMQLLDRLNHRHATATTRLRELVQSRTADPDTQEQVLALLERWLTLGRHPTIASAQRPAKDAVDSSV